MALLWGVAVDWTGHSLTHTAVIELLLSLCLIRRDKAWLMKSAPKTVCWLILLTEKSEICCIYLYMTCQPSSLMCSKVSRKQITLPNLNKRMRCISHQISVHFLSPIRNLPGPDFTNLYIVRLRASLQKFLMYGMNESRIVYILSFYLDWKYLFDKACMVCLYNAWYWCIQVLLNSSRFLLQLPMYNIIPLDSIYKYLTVHMK